MEPKVKRVVSIALFEIPASDLYPDGKMYKVSLQRIKRSGEADTYYVSTDNYNAALDYAEAWLEHGAIDGRTQA